MTSLLFTAALLIAALAISSCTTPPLPQQGCVHPDSVICDNFEHAPQTSRWSNTNTLALSQEQRFSGKQSLRIAAPGGKYNRNYVSFELEDTGLQTQLYGRMMIWLDARNARSGDFSFVQVEGDATRSSGAPERTRVVARGRLDARFDHFFANYDTLGDRDKDGVADWLTDCWKHPPFTDTTPPPDAYLIPQNTWSCVQWHYDAANHEMAFWLNGEPLSGIHMTGQGDGCLGHRQRDFWVAPAEFDTLKVGVEQYHPHAEPRTLYIDDLEVAAQPVACPER